MIGVLADLFISRGVTGFIRSDNGGVFAAAALTEWITKLGAKTAYIEPGGPRENGYVEIFKGKLWDELLAREAFSTLAEARVLIERWRRHYDTILPYSSPGYRPPAPEVALPRVPLAADSSGPAGSAQAGTATMHKILPGPPRG